MKKALKRMAAAALVTLSVLRGGGRLCAERRGRTRGWRQRCTAGGRNRPDQGDAVGNGHGRQRQLLDQGPGGPDAGLLLSGLHDRRGVCRQTHGDQRQDDRRGVADRRRRDRQHRLRNHHAARPHRLGGQGRPGNDDEGQRHQLRPGAGRTHRRRGRHHGRRLAGRRSQYHHPRKQLAHAEQRPALHHRRIPVRRVVRRVDQPRRHRVDRRAERRFGDRHLRSARSQRRHRDQHQTRQRGQAHGELQRLVLPEQDRQQGRCRGHIRVRTGSGALKPDHG